MDQKTNMIRLADFPQLRLITWNRCDDGMVDEREALAIYERNWRFVDQARLDENEKALIERLVQDLGRTDECLTGLIISGLQNCFMPSIAHYSRRHAVSSEEGRLLSFYWANIVNHWILIFYILPEKAIAYCVISSLNRGLEIYCGNRFSIGEKFGQIVMRSEPFSK